MEEAVFAAIDLGTNSCRLLVAKPVKNKLQIIDSFSRVVRLGEGIGQNGFLSAEAIVRSIKALRVCLKKIKQNNVTHLRSVATEACRRAANSEDFIKQLENELSLKLEIISSAEEARLAVAGCIEIINRDIPYALAFDIGGGSTEVMWLRIKNNRVRLLEYISLPFGVVTLSETYGTYISTSKVYKEIQHKIQKILVPFVQKNNVHILSKQKRMQIIGTSGTITTLAAIYLNLKQYSRSAVDGLVLPIAKIHEIGDSLREMNYQSLNPMRADLVVAGSAILEGICDACPMEDYLMVADRGVREGILLDFMLEYQSD